MGIFLLQCSGNASGLTCLVSILQKLLSDGQKDDLKEKNRQQSKHNVHIFYLCKDDGEKKLN